MKFKEALKEVYTGMITDFKEKDAKPLTFEENHEGPEMRMEFDIKKSMVTVEFNGEKREWKVKDDNKYSVAVLKTLIKVDGGIKQFYITASKNTKIKDLFFVIYKGYFVTAFKKGYGKVV